MTATRTPVRTRMLLGCALAALVAAPGAARAQAFNANPAVVAGSVTFDRATPGVETITVETPSAVINWTPIFSPPAPDPIVFLPGGNVATFRNGSANADFAVLNRIIPVSDSRIRFDGTVIGRLQTAAGSVPGGTVVFSSPTGIIVGANALFDVGNLLLTTLAPELDASGNFFIGGTFRLGGGGQFGGSAVVTEAGARFNAPSEGSWIAMVAPRVEHGGNVRVNGSAAYVAAEQVQIRINQGLFDIDIQVGTTQAAPIVHSGASGGPASSGAGDNHIVYLAAAPQNQAITLLLGGAAGFDAAVSATIENGAIVLSAGHDIAGTAISPVQEGAGASDFLIRSGSYTSDVFGRASQNFIVGDVVAGSVAFEQDLSIAARQRADLIADQGYILRVAGNAFVSAANLEPVIIDATTSDVTGGFARIFAGSGARVEIAGDATIDVSARGAVNPADPAGVAGSGTGGNAFVTSDKGNIDIGGNLAMRSDGSGGRNADGTAANVGGAGRGGVATVEALGGGVLRVGGNADISAGGTGSDSSGALGGEGTGGEASLSAETGGTITIGGGASVAATGTGGQAPGADSTGGAGRGGTALIVATGGTLDVPAAASARADGIGGDGATGGTGIGGRARIEATAGRVASLGTLSARANGSGGAAAFGIGGTGGTGRGGDAGIRGRAGLAEGLVSGGALILEASGTGGRGGDGGGRGGDGTGGAADATADPRTGRLQAGALSALAIGTGGTGPGRGGDGTGGTVVAGTLLPAPDDALVAPGFSGRADFGPTMLAASGNGGTGGVGGTGTGGSATLVSVGGPVTVGVAATLAANGNGGLGAGGTRGAAAGGNLLVAAVAAPAGPAGSLTVAALSGQADALGDAGAPSTMGRWRFVATGGSAIALGSANIGAAATGNAAPIASSFQLDDSILTVSGTGIFTTDGSIALAATGTGRLVGGDITLVSRAGITLTHVGRPAGAQTVDADRFTATTQGAYAAAPGTAVQGRSGVTIGAGTDASLAQTTSLGTIAVIAGNDVRVGASVAGAAVQLNAGRDVVVDAAGSLGGAGTATVLASAGRDYVAAPGSAVRGTNVDLRAGRDAAVGRTDATNQLAVTAGRTARFADTATGREIRVTSTDIDIGASGRVGDAATDLVALQVQGGGAATTLGGAGQGLGYTLDQAEAGRVRGDTVRVTAPGQITVRDLAFAGSAAPGGIERVEIATPGTVRVNGALLLGSAGAGDSISIAAGNRLEVATEAGSIRVRNAAGAPAGNLAIAAGDIWVADSDTLGQLAADPDFAGRDELLETNPGADRPQGQIEANAIRLAPTRTLFVRNSGTAAAFAGITVGPGGLVIDPSGAGPATVFAFGRRLNADGSVTTNIPFFRQVDYSRGSSSGYTNQSEFNRCLINAGFCGDAVIAFPPPDVPRDIFRVPPQAPPGDPIETDFLAEPLIEEPVTSGSDSTLWIGPDDDEDEDDEDEAEPRP